jgi:hypothetical protein
MPTPKQKILTDIEVLGDAVISGTISVEDVEISTEGAQQNYVLQFRDGKFIARALTLEGVDVSTSVALTWWMGN